MRESYRLITAHQSSNNGIVLLGSTSEIIEGDIFNKHVRLNHIVNIVLLEQVSGLVVERI